MSAPVLPVPVADVLLSDAAVMPAPDEPMAAVSVPGAVALLPTLVPVAIVAASAPVPAPDVPLAMPGLPVAVSVAPVAPTGAVVAAGVVVVASVVAAVFASCLLQAVRPRAKTPARRILIGCFMIVTSRCY